MNRFVGLGFASALSLVGCGSTTKHGTPTAAGGAAQGGAAGAQAGSAGTSSGTAGAGGTTGTTGGAGGSSAGAAGAPMTPDAACRAVIEAQCEAKTRCGLYGDVTLCTEFAELCPDYYFSEGSTRTVDALVGCLDTLRNASCWEVDLGIFPPCLTAGTLADGESCTYGSQCVSSQCADLAGDGCETCQHLPGPNEACTPRVTECVPGYFCSPETSLCTPNPTATPAAEGQPCSTTTAPFVPCQRELVCGANSVCRTLPGSGDPCPEGLCGPDLLCHTPTPSNPICSDFYGCIPPCAAGTHCVDMSGTPTCVPFSGVGESCANVGEICQSGLTCAMGQCAVRPRVGDPCVNGVCTIVLSCVNGMCAIPEPPVCP